MVLIRVPSQENSESRSNVRERLSKPLSNALGLLDTAARDGQGGTKSDAVFLLAELNFVSSQGQESTTG